MANGTVKWFDMTKGYGFIEPEAGSSRNDVFVHKNDVQGSGLSNLTPGQKVEYDLASAPDGKVSATNLKLGA